MGDYYLHVWLSDDEPIGGEPFEQAGERPTAGHRFFLNDALQDYCPFRVESGLQQGFQREVIGNQPRLHVTGATTVEFVSHRLSFISLADRIIFLKEGRIEVEGTHTDLLQRSKIYRDLFNIKVRSVA